MKKRRALISKEILQVKMSEKIMIEEAFQWSLYRER